MTTNVMLMRNRVTLTISGGLSLNYDLLLHVPVGLVTLIVDRHSS